MNTNRYAIPALLVSLALALAACDSQKGPAAAAEKSAEAPQPAATGASADARKTLDVALGAYEKARALLASDKTDGLADAAASVEKAAKEAATKASAELRPHLEAMAKAAADLKAQAGDLEGARKAFGELSRPTVALIAAEPELAKGRHVFECGMAKGYQKWVQTNQTVENPYMGTKMLACGSGSSWQ